MQCPNCEIKLELVAVDATEEQKKDAKEFADKAPEEGKDKEEEVDEEEEEEDEDEEEEEE